MALPKSPPEYFYANTISQYLDFVDPQSLLPKVNFWNQGQVEYYVEFDRTTIFIKNLLPIQIPTGEEWSFVIQQKMF